jgi:phosphoribosylglycinamide formyltransferase 1
VSIAVFYSGNGTNLQAIMDDSKSGLLSVNVALMVCDNTNAYAIIRTRNEGTTMLVLDIKDFPSQEGFEARTIE